MELIGWLGSLLLTGCALPLVVQTVREGHGKSVNTQFLVAWIIGIILTLISLLGKSGVSYLLVSYGASLVFAGIISYFKWMKPL